MRRRDRAVLNVGRFLIFLASRRLSSEGRGRYHPEWISELYEIIADEDLRWWISRVARILLFSLDHQRSVSRLNGVPAWREIATYSLLNVLVVSAVSSPFGWFGLWKYFRTERPVNLSSIKDARLVYAALPAVPTVIILIVRYDLLQALVTCGLLAYFNSVVLGVGMCLIQFKEWLYNKWTVQLSLDGGH